LWFDFVGRRAVVLGVDAARSCAVRGRSSSASNVGAVMGAVQVVAEDCLLSIGSDGGTRSMVNMEMPALGVANEQRDRLAEHGAIEGTEVGAEDTSTCVPHRQGVRRLEAQGP